MAEGHELPSRIWEQAPPPGKFFEMNMPRDAIWCILRHKFTVECYLFFSRDHVPCHIASFDREYLLHVHRPRCVWMIFPI